MKIQISETSLKSWRFGDALFTCPHGNILEKQQPGAVKTLGSGAKLLILIL